MTSTFSYLPFSPDPVVSRRGDCEKKAAFASSLNLPQLVDLNLLKGSSGLIKRAFSEG